MRTLTLTNNRGETMDVTTQTLFMHNLKNFGYTMKTSFMQIGNHWTLTNGYMDQKTLSASIYCGGSSPYETYREFAIFCQAYPITINYTPDPDYPENTYYRKVIITALGKTELQKYGGLVEDLTITPLTLWYKELSAKYEAISTTDGWVWDDSGNTTFPVTWGSSETASISINSVSVEDCPVKLTIYGPCLNPTWIHYVNGSKKETGTLNLSVPSESYVVIDNYDFPSIKMYEKSTNKLVGDSYGARDFSTDCFMYFKYGKNTITVGPTTSDPILFEVEARELYGTV